jgi:hypothetical protein
MSTGKKQPLSIPGIPDDFFIVKKGGLSQAQAMTAYLGGSMFQTICDNPITAYRCVMYCIVLLYRIDYLCRQS